MSVELANAAPLDATALIQAELGTVLEYLRQNIKTDSAARQLRQPLFEIANALMLDGRAFASAIGAELLQAVHAPVPPEVQTQILNNHTQVFGILAGVPWSFDAYVRSDGKFYYPNTANLGARAGQPAQSMSCIFFNNVYLHLVLGLMPYSTYLGSGQPYGVAQNLAHKTEFRTAGVLQEPVISGFVPETDALDQLPRLLEHYGVLFSVQVYNDNEGQSPGHAFIALKMDNGYHVLESFGTNVHDYGLIEDWINDHRYKSFTFALMDIGAVKDFSQVARSYPAFMQNLSASADRARACHCSKPVKIPRLEFTLP